MHHPEDTESRLLAAAFALWTEGGFSAVTTRAVARRAEVNEVTLFRHFGNKAGLIEAMVDHTVDRLSAPRGEEGTEAQSVTEDLTGWARAYLEETEPVADVLLLSLAQARQKREVAGVVPAFARRLTKALGQHLQDLRSEGRICPGDLELDEVARQFYAALFSRALTVHFGAGRGREQEAGAVARVFARALGEASAAAPHHREEGSTFKP